MVSIRVNCTICELPIDDGEMIGDGDGTGCKFAHPICYYRREWAVKDERMEAYFTAAEFENVPVLLTKPPEFFKCMGEIVAGRTKELKNTESRLALADKDLKAMRLSIGMILLSHGGTIKITRKAQEGIDERDSVESVTEIDGTMTLRYRAYEEG